MPPVGSDVLHLRCPSRLPETRKSKGRGCNRSPGRGQPGVVLSRSVLRLRAAAVHGRSRGGRRGRVGQAGIVTRGSPEELGAQAAADPPTLRHRGEGRVTHRPQAGVLTAQRHRTHLSRELGEQQIYS